MDPVTIAGLILAAGQCLQPLIACLHAVSECLQAKKTIHEALKKTIAFSQLLELLRKDFEQINEFAIQPGYRAFLCQTLEDLCSALASHKAEVDGWIVQLGLSAKLEVNGASYIPQSTVIHPLLPTTPVDVVNTVTDVDSDAIDIDIKQCRVFGWRFRVAQPSKSREKGEFMKTCLSFRALKFTTANPDSEKRSDKDLRNTHRTSLHPRILIGKIKYAYTGEKAIKEMTENLQSWSTLLSQTFTIMLSLKALRFKTSIGSPKTSSCITHPIWRFVDRARQRDEERKDVLKISKEDWRAHYHSSQVLGYVDVHAVEATAQYQIFCGDAVPHPSTVTGAMRLESGAAATGCFPAFRNCVFVDRGLWSEETEEATLRIGRLFADEEDDASLSSDPDRLLLSLHDGDMLRCVAAIRMYDKSVLAFQLPPGSAKNPLTLRTTLPKQRSASAFGLPSKADRAKLALRLANAVLVVHSLGLVHKRINPETILLVESAGESSSHSSRRSLGYPYLVAFHTARRNEDPSECTEHTMDAARRAIYYQPRYQEDRKTDKYRMLDDIFALGVCLFEIGLWRSLFVWDTIKRDYVQDDSFVKLSETCGKWNGMSSPEMVEARIHELIRVVRKLLPSAMGPEYTKAVVACLEGGTKDSPLAVNRSSSEEDPVVNASNEVHLVDEDDTWWDSETSKPDSISYLQLILQNLEAVYDSPEHVNPLHRLRSRFNAR